MTGPDPDGLRRHLPLGSLIATAFRHSPARRLPPRRSCPMSMPGQHAGLHPQGACSRSDRTPAMTARDANRKPAELLALSGVKPGDRVVEFASSASTSPRCCPDIVGPKGMVYMYRPALHRSARGRRQPRLRRRAPERALRTGGLQRGGAAAEHRRACSTCSTTTTCR